MSYVSKNHAVVYILPVPTILNTTVKPGIQEMGMTRDAADLQVLQSVDTFSRGQDWPDIKSQKVYRCEEQPNRRKIRESGRVTRNLSRAGCFTLSLGESLLCKNHAAVHILHAPTILNTTAKPGTQEMWMAHDAADLQVLQSVDTLFWTKNSAGLKAAVES